MCFAVMVHLFRSLASKSDAPAEWFELSRATRWLEPVFDVEV